MIRMKRLSIKTKSSKNSGFPVAVISTIVVGLALRNEYVLSPADIYARNSPSVVTVTSLVLEKDPFSPRKFMEVPKGSGTGFSFVHKDYIVTNAHVIENADAIKVNDEPATILGIDSQHDIVVLKLMKDDISMKISPLKKCTAPAVVGERVLAIGNPFGFDKSMSAGIISGVERAMGNLVNLLQTDAAINPGNSGGPLLAAESGCVFGVNTAIASASGSSSGLGFAIPIDVVDDIVHSIIEQKQGDHRSIQLGITLLPDDYANALGVHGAIIADVLPDGIASGLGLVGTYRDEFGRPMLGDIIVEIDGKPVKERGDITKLLEASTRAKGSSVSFELKVLRSTGIESFRVELCA